MPRATIIEPQNEGEAPLSYQLSPGQTIETLAVAADFDGSGAAGDFLPTLSMYAQDGRRLGTFSAQTTVVAGNSEQVTFFPFAPPASSGGTGTIATITSPDGSINVTNASGPVVQLLGYTAPQETEYVAGSAAAGAAGGSALLSCSHGAGAALLDYTNPTQPAIIFNGIYTLSGRVVTGENVNPGEGVSASFQFGLGSFPTVENYFTGSNFVVAGRVGLSLTCYLPFGTILSLGVGNDDTIPHTFNLSGGTLQRITQPNP